MAKTVNLPSEATVDQVRDVFTHAWRAGIKGITVYRDRSRPGQVFHLPTIDNPLATAVVRGSYSGGPTITTPS